jgi:hypothetical protein
MTAEFHPRCRFHMTGAILSKFILTFFQHSRIMVGAMMNNLTHIVSFGGSIHTSPALDSFFSGAWWRQISATVWNEGVAI